MSLKRVAITIGDPAGIGPEIILKALLDHADELQNCIPIVFGPKAVLIRYLKLFNRQASVISLKSLDNLPERPQKEQIYLFETEIVQPLPNPGEISAAGGSMAFKAIKTAIEMGLEKKVHAVVTAPINKQSLKATQVPFLDHTSIFSAFTESSNTMTMFLTGNLRIFFYSRHIAFKDIVASLDQKKLLTTILTAIGYLEKMGFDYPRLAVAALNPHAGENGLFGDEEQRIIQPAIQQARDAGWNVYGPIPADSVFHLAWRGRYDAVLSLYHDQGHIAAKTLDFFGTVSVTLGLPFLRTSVDHGTAFEIAGRGVANETSMVKAIQAAAKYAW